MILGESKQRASGTALLIAASLVLLSRDPKYSRTVRKPDLPTRILEQHSPLTRWFVRNSRYAWFRSIAKLLERVTVPGILLHYARRKECIARLTHEALESGNRQVVILGAGFDGLSLALLEEFPGAQIWEIDHPATQREKILACSGLHDASLHFLPLDLAAAPLDKNALIAAGFDLKQRTFWIAEGLLMYLPANIIASLTKTSHELSATGSRFVFTFMERKSSDAIRFHSQTALVDWWLRHRGERFLWGTTRSQLTDWICPWHIERIFDHNDLRSMEPVVEPLAEGEVICLAEAAIDKSNPSC